MRPSTDVTIYVKTQSSAKNGTHQKWLHEALYISSQAKWFFPSKKVMFDFRIIFHQFLRVGDHMSSVDGSSASMQEAATKHPLTCECP